MKKALSNKSANVRELEGGIEWIVARQLVPIENELLRLRAHVEALKEAMQPW